MKLRFKIGEIVETEIYSGFYEIHILGGFDIRTNPDFYLQIVNIETGNDIELKEKYLKARDYKDGKRAVKFYTFEVGKYGKYRISAHNYKDIVIKHHMPTLFSFIFDSFIFRMMIFRSKNKIMNVDDVEILIS